MASDTTHDVVFKLNPCTDLTAVGEDGMRRIPLGKHTLMVGAASHFITVVSRTCSLLLFVSPNPK